MRFILYFTIIILSTGITQGQKLLTLDEAVQIAMQRNSILQISKNNIEAYESGVLASYGNLLPSVGAQAGWDWTRSENAGGIRYIPNVGPYEVPPTVSESNTYSAGIGSNWTLFNGLANIAGISQSRNELKSAELSLERLKQDIVFQTITLYYDVINFQQLLKVSEENVLWNEKNLETITERNKLGAVTLADVYAQQVRAGNAELEVVRTSNNLETAKSNLLYYLGLNVLENYRFSDSLSVSELNVIDRGLTEDFEALTTLVNEALRTRRDFESARLSLESAYNGITIARSGHFPTLSNNANFYTVANSVDNLFDSKTYSVGLTLNIPIFSGFSVVNRVQQAEVSAKTREIELSDLEREIMRSVQKTYLDLQAAKKLVEVSRRNVVAAEENLKIESEKYNLGAGTLLNVLIANSEFTNAQTNFINSQFAYITLSEQLKYELGVLDYKRYE